MALKANASQGRHQMLWAIEMALGKSNHDDKRKFVGLANHQMAYKNSKMMKGKAEEALARRRGIKLIIVV